MEHEPLQEKNMYQQENSKGKNFNRYNIFNPAPLFIHQWHDFASKPLSILSHL